jgi:hypothetical protein
MPRNIYINYIDCGLSWHIKHAGNKAWNTTNIRDFEGRHEAWL